MKKIILLTAIAVSTFSCKPKHDDPAPIIPPPVADSVKFYTNKNGGDTIKTYLSSSTSISLSFSMFKKNIKLNNQNINIYFETLDQDGLFKVSGIKVSSKTLASNDTINLSFTPSPVIGIQRIILYAIVNGKKFSEILSFVVQPRENIPYFVTYSNKYFSNQISTSNIFFNFKIENDILTPRTYYYKTSQLISQNGTFAGTTLLKNEKTNSAVYVNKLYSFPSNLSQSFKLELTNNLEGKYFLPIVIYDENNSFIYDTITYIVK